MSSGVYPRKSALERFKSYVRVEGRHWIWTGSLSSGYGAFWFEGKWVSAHVYSYATFVGAIPQGHQIRHKCDIRACVAPKCLTTGTAKDNAGDREERSRHPHLATMSKLSDKQVAELRRKYGARRKFDRPSLKEIGLEYGISAPSVCWLLKGHTYQKGVMPT